MRYLAHTNEYVCTCVYVISLSDLKICQSGAVKLSLVVSQICVSFITNECEHLMFNGHSCLLFSEMPVKSFACFSTGSFEVSIFSNTICLEVDFI